jgi:hypothetical protein
MIIKYRVFTAIAAACLTFLPFGCSEGDGDPDDVAEKKEPIPLDQVPPAVLAIGKKHHPELTFFAAAKDTFQGKDSIELRGKTKNGKIKELEIAPDGTFLGVD